VHAQIPLDLVVGNFAFGFLPGSILVMIVELIMSGIFFLVCFHDQLGDWIARLEDIYREMGGKQGENRREEVDIVTQMERAYGIVIIRCASDLFVSIYSHVHRHTLKYVDVAADAPRA
jgi:hypothetical protein